MLHRFSICLYAYDTRSQLSALVMSHTVIDNWCSTIAWMISVWIYLWKTMFNIMSVNVIQEENVDI